MVQLSPSRLGKCAGANGAQTRWLWHHCSEMLNAKATGSNFKTHAPLMLFRGLICSRSPGPFVSAEIMQEVSRMRPACQSLQGKAAHGALKSLVVPSGFKKCPRVWDLGVYGNICIYLSLSLSGCIGV